MQGGGLTSFAHNQQVLLIEDSGPSEPECSSAAFPQICMSADLTIQRGTEGEGKHLSSQAGESLSTAKESEMKVNSLCKSPRNPSLTRQKLCFHLGGHVRAT